MFKLRELSRFLGRPVQLVRFDLGPLSWGYTAGDTPVELDGLTYVPSGISVSAVRETTEVAKNRVTITLPIALDPNAPNPPPTQAFAGIWRPYPPARKVIATVMSMHRGDADAEVVVNWRGRVAQPEFTDTLLTLTCNNTRARHRGAGGGHRCQRACDLVVYGQGPGECNLDKDLFAIPFTLTAASGLTITAPEFGTSSLPMDGGWVEWMRPDGLIEERTIMAHSGDTLTLEYGAADLAEGLEGTAWPGCAHNWEACAARDNTDNYGGVFHLPTKNPWSGNPP
ncbi:phage BR0599 family protein [Pseudoxanthomonas sp. GW2]|uniref:phage BR0599 family protein n=1 Tax=Pseudoxanthomonas sp. GW2 TaxID=1211114 RepID=UPI0002D8FF5F|nr:phage BR0599 family protein [Pseudoxanthomonas sp. GW2]